MKKALITGITGQDGSYLSELLLGKGYEVHGLVRRSSRDPFVRVMSHKDKVHIHYGDLRDTSALERIIEAVKPDEVYNLAAQSHVGISFDVPEETYEINYAGLGRLVHAVLLHSPKSRIYQASTSEMFGTTPPLQNEDSVFAPVSPYAEAKLKAHEDYVKAYREKNGLFICSGILFNHESPRRGENFVTRKITISLAKIKLGLSDTLSLGNLNAKRDWGYAKDYVEAMWSMLQLDTPEDFVIASGQQHSVREFVEAAGKALGMSFTWEGEGVDEVGKDVNGVVRIKINPEFYRPREVHSLQGDASKAIRMLSWQPKTSFEELVALMAESDLKAIQSGLLVS